jgi:hypothetical protein
MVSEGRRLSTRQAWVLWGVAHGRIDFDPALADPPWYAMDGRGVQWALSLLALRGLIAFDPWLPGPPRLTRAGTAALFGVARRVDPPSPRRGRPRRRG